MSCIRFNWAVLFHSINEFLARLPCSLSGKKMKLIVFTLFAVFVACSVSCTDEGAHALTETTPTPRDAVAEIAHEQQGQSETTEVKAGYYEIGHPEQDAVNEFLSKSTVAVWLSWHNGISIESSSGKGWDNNLTLEQLRRRLDNTEDKTQAAIVLEKNFTGEDKEDEAVAALLKQIGFETIVVQSYHSSAIVIDKIIQNSN